MANIILDTAGEKPQHSDESARKAKTGTNLFQGRTESAENSKFPDWDIVPPNQFINPRIKKS